MSAKAGKCGVRYIKGVGAWKSSAHLCYTSPMQSSDFQEAVEAIWAAASAPRVEEEGSLALEGVVNVNENLDPQDIDPGTISLTRDMITSEPILSQHKVGDEIFTEWGTATIVRVKRNGGYVCSWPGHVSTYSMYLYDEGSAIPDGAAKDREQGLVQLTSRVLSEAMDVQAQ